jgi:hypothetical protein
MEIKNPLLMVPWILQDHEGAQVLLTTYLSSTKEKHLFTFRKVGLVSQCMFKERGSQMREEYYRDLNTTLSEAYDTFVKFMLYNLE